MQIYSAPLEIKRASPTGEGVFRAIAASFGNVDRQGDTIAPGAFAGTLNDWQTRGGRIPLLWQHDTKEPIGAIQQASETRAGLEIEGKLALDDVFNAQRAFSLMKQGALSLSIGYDIPQGGAELKANGVRELRRIDLLEVSTVSIPADPFALIHEVKGARDLEDMLRTYAGMSQREAKRFITAGRQAIHDGDEDDEAAIAALAARIESFTEQLKR